MTPQYCSYPECNCPFDAPADPNWCARGYPKQNKKQMSEEELLREAVYLLDHARLHMGKIPYDFQKRCNIFIKNAEIILNKKESDDFDKKNNESD